MHHREDRVKMHPDHGYLPATIPIPHAIGYTTHALMADCIVTPDTTYEIVRPLGSGGMGQVLLVQSSRQPQPVALKFLQPQWMTEGRIEGFKREFALLSELHHPHLCRAYDFGYSTSHGRYFFTSEFVEGEQLYQALMQASVEEIEAVMLQILGALDFLHSIGLVHFDVKGDNVLITRSARGKPSATLVDLGVTSPSHKKLTEIAGTLHYIAPELLLPDPIADGRCDLYSFGVMCYRLLAGQFPYTFQTFDDVWQWHRTHPHLDIEPLKQRGLPDYLCQMIARCMRPQPGERFSRAGVVMDFLALHSGKTQSRVRYLQRTQVAEGPFVGRETLMATIRNNLRTAKWSGSLIKTGEAGSQRAFLLTGRDGMGKTRFLQELKFVAQLADYSVRLIDGALHGTTWEALCEALGVTGTGLTVEELQARLFTATRQRPICLCVDNLHRATSRVQQGIYGLMGGLYTAGLTQEAPPLVCVATVSPGQHPSALESSMVVEMHPLTRDNIAAYLQQLVGLPEDFEAFVTAVWDFSGGIPLLMVEAARNYHQDQTLPASIEDLYDVQVAGVTQAARQILQLLAFANRPLPYALIEQIHGAPITKEIAELRQALLLRHDPATDHYAFSTGALAAVLQADLTDAMRRAFADPLTEWMTHLPGGTALDAAPYARYSAHPDRAATIVRQAAQLAEQTGNAMAAIEWWRILETLQVAHPDAAMAATRKIATLLLYQGRYDECEAVTQSIIRRTGTPQADELKLLGLLHRVRRKPLEAIPYYDQALQLVPHDPTDPAYLFLENERGQSYLEGGDVQSAVPILERTYEASRHLPREKQIKVTNNNLGAALGQLGRVDEAVQFYQEKLQAFAHDHRLQGSIYSQLGATQMRAGRIDDAIRTFEAAWQITSAAGDLHNGPIILDNLIALLQKKGEYSAALNYAKKSLALKSVRATEHDMGRTMMNLAALYLNLGVPDLAARHLIQAMRIVRRCRDYQLLGWIHINFGYLYKDIGRFMESLNAFEETIFIGEEHHDDELVRWGRYGATDVCIEHGALEEASQFWARLEPVLAGITDEEFQTRCTILQHRMQAAKEPTPSEAMAGALEAIVQRCAAAGWIELEWEVEYYLGTLYQRRKEFEAVKLHLRRAAALITTLADRLSEEYRDGFLKHRIRTRVFAELQAADRNEVYISQITGGATGVLDQASPAADRPSVISGATSVAQREPKSPGKRHSKKCS